MSSTTHILRLAPLTRHTQSGAAPPAAKKGRRSASDKGRGSSSAKSGGKSGKKSKSASSKGSRKSKAKEGKDVKDDGGSGGPAPLRTVVFRPPTFDPRDAKQLQQALDYCDEHGYAVLFPMYEEKRQDELEALLMDYLEALNPKIERDDPDTWTNANWPGILSCGIFKVGKRGAEAPL